MMTPRRSSLRRAVAAVAVALCLPLLAACGDDEKPDSGGTTPSETPSMSESPSASETPEPDPETAKEFIRRWQEAEDQMQVTGDTETYRSLVTKRCTSCFELADAIDKIHEAGGSVDFPGSSIVSLARSGGVDKRPEFTMRLKIPKTVVIDKAGAAPRSLPAGETTYVVTLIRRGNSWQVHNQLQRPQ